MQMMRLAWLLIGVLTSVSAQAQSLTSIESSGFSEYVERNLGDWSIPGASVVVFDKEGTVYARGFGVRQVGRPAKVDPDTAFGIASVTKTQIAATIMVLESQGKLKVSDMVQKHIPEFRVADPRVSADLTLHDCLSHRSGIETYRDWIEEVPFLSGENALKRSHLLPQALPLRQEHRYNNFCFVILAEVISRKASMPWQKALHELLWKPLGTRSSYSGPQEFARKDAILPTGDGWLP
ncbi:MAG: serine hydrolase domain-containing protein, partial [Sphingorhabdus sp.]